MFVTASKWGNSLAIRIPSVLAKRMRLKKEMSLSIILEEDSLILSPKRNTLSEMMERVTPENIHSEIDTGGSVGNEKW